MVITNVKRDRRRTMEWIFTIRRDEIEYFFEYWTEDEAKKAHNLARRVLDAAGVNYDEPAPYRAEIEV